MISAHLNLRVCGFLGGLWVFWRSSFDGFEAGNTEFLKVPMVTRDDMAKVFCNNLLFHSASCCGFLSRFRLLRKGVNNGVKASDTVLFVVSMVAVGNVRAIFEFSGLRGRC